MQASMPFVQYQSETTPQRVQGSGFSIFSLLFLGFEVTREKNV